MGAWLQEGIVPIDAGARSPRPARRLSIEATFTLIAAINGIVLAYLLATALRVLRVSGGGERQVVVSLALPVLLAVLAVLSYLILKRRTWSSRLMRRSCWHGCINWPRSIRMPSRVFTKLSCASPRAAKAAARASG